MVRGDGVERGGDLRQRRPLSWANWLWTLGSFGLILSSGIVVVLRSVIAVPVNAMAML